MKKVKKVLLILLILLSYTIICKQIYNNFKKEIKKEEIQIEQKRNPEIIGILEIPKLNLVEELYQKNSIHNNVEEHVTILPESKLPNEEESIIILAAHSGTGPIAYFKHLDQLNINDTIFLVYDNKKIAYQIINIWEETKNGYIHVNKEPKNQLILTTCSPTDKKKQLIINSTTKKS